MNRATKTLLRLGCATIIFILIFSKIKFPSARVFAQPVLVFAFSLAICLNICQSLLCVFRWRFIQSNIGIKPAFGVSFWAYMECSFCNQALPSFVGGDAIRVLRWRNNGIPANEAAASVLFDRVFGAIGAAVLALAACGLMWKSPVERFKTFSAFFLSVCVLCACLLLLLVVRMKVSGKWFPRLQRIHAFLSTLDEWSPTGPYLLFLVLLGVCGQLMAGLAVFALGRALSIDLSLPMLVSITGIILLLSMIPISLAGWGIREAGFIALLVPFGVSDSRALALGVLFGISTLAGALPGGVSILLDLGKPARALEAARRTELEQTD